MNGRGKRGGREGMGSGKKEVLGYKERGREKG